MITANAGPEEKQSARKRAGGKPKTRSDFGPFAGIADDAKRSEHLSEILKAIAHPLRLRIVAVLADGDEHVNALAQRLDVKQSVISQHLSIMRMRGLVDSTRSNGFAYYRLVEPRLREMLQCMAGCSVKF